MRLLVSGASGLVGRTFAKQSLAAGHDLVCISRNAQHNSNLENCSWLKLDLGQIQPSTSNIGKIDWVVHCAIDSHNFRNWEINNCIGENIVKLAKDNVAKGIVLTSSIAVYDFFQLPPDSTISPSSKIIKNNDLRQDDYALFKRRQEDHLLQLTSSYNLNLIIARIGLVYTDDFLCPDHAGITLGPVQLIAKHHGHVPLVNNKNVANALLKLMANAPEQRLVKTNIVDPAPVSQTNYVNDLASLQKLGLLRLSLNWTTVSRVGQFLAKFTSILLGQNRVPNRLKAGGLARRIKPFRFATSEELQLSIVQSENL